MPRTIRDSRLDTRSARSKLAPSAKPYFRLLDKGVHFGYRKGKAGGSWVVRVYLGEQRYAVETIGIADDGASDADGERILDFAQAQTKARARAAEMALGDPGSAKEPETTPYTVRDCLADYLQWMDRERKSAADARSRARAHILPKLGEIPCADLTTAQIRDWQRALAAGPARVRSKEGARQRFKAAPTDDESKRKRRSSANRTLTILKAALNRAWREGRIGADDAWRRVEPFQGADAARIRYLTVAECQRLINACPDDFRALVQAALATGCRYGELARLTVADFDPDAATVQVRISKSGKPRHVHLTEEGARLFAGLAAGRPGAALLLPRADGGAWQAAHQARPMKAACERAGIAPAVGFHGLRHTYASLAIMAGGAQLVVARNLGHADTRMVEKHYGHLSPSYVRDEIRRVAPVFGFEPPKVRAIR